jgi:multiple sugar transport system permease protein
MLKRLFSTSDPFQPSLGWKAISYVLLIAWTVVVIFPFYWLFITGFKRPIDVSGGPRFLPFIDYQPTLNAWQEMLVGQGATVTRPYINTLIVGTSSALLALIVGTMAAYALTRFDYRPKPALIASFAACVLLAVVLTIAGVVWWLAAAVGIVLFVIIALTVGKRFKGTMNNNDVTFWLISQRILPPVAVVIPIYLMFQALGLLDTHASLIITYSAANLPIVVWFMRDYFMSIPFEIEESAFIDGASRYQVLRKIVIPLAVPGLIATFLIILVFSWNEYVLGVFLSLANSQTMPQLVVAQNATRGPQWWNISVLVTLMITPLMALAVILERYIAKGLLVGAVKG